MNYTYRLYLLLTSIVGGLFLTSCNKEWTADNNGLSNEVPTDERQLVVHEVSVALDGVLSRVSYKDENEGLQLSWNADETLGAYIRKTDNTIIFAGTMTSSGEAGDRGARRFSGNISQKGDNEQYIYIHPALTGETQGQAAKGNIDLSTPSGSLGSTAHLTKYIPLIWNEGSSLVSNQGYAIHLRQVMAAQQVMMARTHLKTIPITRLGRTTRLSTGMHGDYSPIQHGTRTTPVGMADVGTISFRAKW